MKLPIPGSAETVPGRVVLVVLVSPVLARWCHISRRSVGWFAPSWLTWPPSPTTVSVDSGYTSCNVANLYSCSIDLKGTSYSSWCRAVSREPILGTRRTLSYLVNATVSLATNLLNIVLWVYCIRTEINLLSHRGNMLNSRSRRPNGVSTCSMFIKGFRR